MRALAVLVVAACGDGASLTEHGVPLDEQPAHVTNSPLDLVLTPDHDSDLVNWWLESTDGNVVEIDRTVVGDSSVAPSF